MTNYCSIGTLAATFGYKGEFILKHHLGRKTALNGLTTIYIEEKKDKLIPYFIEAVSSKSDSEVMLKLEGIDDKESAQKLTRKMVWLTDEDFHEYAASSAPISFLGYTIMQEEKVLGEVLEIIEQPHQLLCKILINDKEVLIPLHENSLLEIDKENKLIYVDIPDGLIEVFL